MTKLEQLIQELCPDGIISIQMSNISKIKRGDRITKKDIISDGGYIVMSGGVNPMGRYSRKNRDADTITISSYGAAGYVNYVREDFWANDVCLSVFPNEDILNKKYLYYVLKSKQQYIFDNTTKAIPDHIPTRFLEELPIPVPPLEVQAEIVRILDKFTELTTELNTELNTELANRKKQFEYYRESRIRKCANYKRLSEIVDIYLGLTATPNYKENGVMFISAKNTSNDCLDLDDVKYISEEDYEKASKNAKPQRGDLLYTRVGSNLGHPVIVDTDQKLCIFVSLGFFRIKEKHDIDIRYVKHWMNTELFWEQVKKNVHGAAKVNLNTGWLKDFVIPVPSFSDQQQIASSLDRFEKLCNDITENLPAEIEARQKQYEYYRDKLLQFAIRN